MGSSFSICFDNIDKKLLNASTENTPLFSLNGLKMKGKIIDIYDGDTITIAIFKPLGEIKCFKCRLYGIDTPELKGQQSEFGIRSRNKLIEWITNGKTVLQSNTIYTRDNIKTICKENNSLVTIECGPFEKYGRLLITIFTKNGTNINQQLINHGFAKPYFGKTKN